MGPPPTVAVENRQPGTTAWRLPGPAKDVGGLAHGNVAGYVANEALRPGQRQRIYVSAPGSPMARIRVFRIGWYGGRGGREVLEADRLPLVRQPPCVHRSATGLTECHWHPTLTFRIPPGLASGVYIAKLSAKGGESDCLFVVEANHPQPLLAQLPTSTYEAYNTWGGDSLYPGGHTVAATGTSQGVEVSYRRPYATATGAGEFFARDVAMVRFLERYGYRLSYTTGASVDRHPGQVAGHKALVDFGHSEYWSQRQVNAFAHARDAGTSLLFFSSDTLAWRVRYSTAAATTQGTRPPSDSMVAYKEHSARDPHRLPATGAFEDLGAALTGSAFHGCITPRVPKRGPPTYVYYSWAPRANVRPSWLFARTRITSLTRIPGIVGYESDQVTPSSPPGTQAVGGGTTSCMRSSSGDRGPGQSKGRAETTIYSAASGALVFKTGTLGWELGLEPVPSASPNAPRAPDPRVVQMTRNVLAHVLHGLPRRRPNPRSHG